MSYRRRKYALQRIIVLAVLSALCFLLLGGRDLALFAQSANPIQIENQNPGTFAWYPNNVANNHEIEGYASLTSVNAGGQISFFVNTSDPQYTLTIYRLGYYQGLGGRQMTSPVTLTGIAQPIPTPDPVTGLAECQWTNPYLLNVPANWLSGMYVAMLTGQSSGKQRLIAFVVRNDGRRSDLIFQSSVTTAQAYNGWGGKSLYDFTSADGIPGVKVSFNRPYDDSDGAGEILSWEVNMAAFLEKEGYDVVYSTDVDTHESGSELLLHKGFLSVGHDEYWSYEMRQNVIAARDQGVSLGFFSANDSVWQIRFEPSRLNGAADRTMVCYKGLTDPAASNPATYYLVTTMWRDPHVTLPAVPEDSFIGIMWNPAEPVDGDITISNPSHWVFANTGLVNGSTLPGLLGYEVDRIYNDASSPAGVVDLAHSSYIFNGTTQFSDMSVYTALSGATVFATGTIQWSFGLSDLSPWSKSPSRVNPAAQQITRNVLAHFISSSATPTASPTATATPSPSAVATPGLVQITAPLNASAVAGNVSITVAKAASVTWANVYIDGDYFASTPPATFTWNSTTVADGSHTISVQGFNTTGSPLASDAVNVLVQNGVVTATPSGTATPSQGPIALIGSTATTTAQITVPSGVQNGDLLLAYYSYWSHAGATAPIGWTLLHSATSSGSGVETVWYRFANNDTPGATYTWTFSGATPYEAGGMTTYRGVDPAAFEDGSCTNQGKSTTPSLCSFTTTFGNDAYVGFFATENTNLVLPNDLAGLAINQYLAGAHFGLAVTGKALGAAGSVPAEVGSMNNGGWATVVFALKPLNSSPTPTATLTATPTATMTRTATPTPSPSATATASATATRTATATVTVTATLTATIAAPTQTATLTTTATRTTTATQTAIATPTPIAITLVGSTNTTTTKTTVPSGVQNGDLLLAFYSYWSFATATAPSGWTLLHSATASGSGVETVWYRFANNDAAGSTYTWAFGGAAPYEAGGMLAYRGADPTAFEDGFCTNQGKSTTPSLCGFTNNNSNDVYVGFFATENTNLALPGDLNGIVINQYLSGSHFGVAAAAKSLGGAAGLPTEVASMNNGGWASIAFALKGLSSPPTPTAIATTSTPTATVIATVLPTIAMPTSTATATTTATQAATVTQTATANPTPIAIAFVGSTNSTTTKLTVPSGVQNGDLLLAFYSYWSLANATAPSGWTLLHSATASGSGVEKVWYRFANNDASGSAYSWSFSGATPYEAGGMLAYRGIDPAAFEDGFCTSQGKSTTPSLCSFTTTFSNDTYVGFFATENTNLVLPADLSGLLTNQYLSGSHFGVAAATKSLGGAALVPADNGSMNNGGWATVVFALKPSSGN